jgi:hypothetical protein
MERLAIIVLLVWNSALSAHIVASSIVSRKRAKKLWKERRAIWQDEAGKMPESLRYVDPERERFPGLDDSLAKRMPDYERKKQAFDKHIDHKY